MMKSALSISFPLRFSDFLYYSFAQGGHIKVKPRFPTMRSAIGH